MLISYSKALEIIRATILPLQSTYKTTLLESIHRIASQDIFAKWDMPNETMSLKEGFGLHLGSLPTYHLITEANPLFVPPNYAIELSTGSTLISGINAVIAKEDVEFNADSTLNIPSSIPVGYNIKQQGEDFCRNQCIVKRCESINAYTLSALASQGLTHIETFSPPKISILSIGNTLLSLGVSKQDGMVYNSNAMSLAARILELGASIQSIEVCSEDTSLIVQKLAELSEEADFIITTGGMGTQDVMHKALAQEVLSVLFHYVQISPARPSALSLLKNKPILHLPGLPLSCLLGFEMLGTPILKRLQHIPLNQQPPIALKNQQMITCKACSTSAIPGVSDGITFTNAPAYQAAMLNTLSTCNGYILIEGQEQIEPGENVLFYPF
ncbi:MAG: molybdopterin molybdotransferase MoeA [Sulfurospirillaceae bacterium]|nr:molybdopterin molybdotransferase MoeA [Sulfurospirillaceae bacterium]